MNRAQFEIVCTRDTYVIITDIGPWDKHPTVTNDAEAVVANLIGYLKGRRLFYNDSMGKTDELLIEDGKFAGFANGKGLEELRAKNDKTTRTQKEL